MDPGAAAPVGHRKDGRRGKRNIPAWKTALPEVFLALPAVFQLGLDTSPVPSVTKVTRRPRAGNGSGCGMFWMFEPPGRTFLKPQRVRDVPPCVPSRTPIPARGRDLWSAGSGSSWAQIPVFSAPQKSIPMSLTRLQIPRELPQDSGSN